MQFTFGLLNEKHPAPHHWISGQVDAAQLSLLQTRGMRHVINLCPASENPSFDEAASARSLGLRYHELPIRGEAGLSLENTKAFDSLLAEIGEQATLIHCATGNRVGALVALRAGWLAGRPSEEALQAGRDYGLTKLESAVATLLGVMAREI